MITISKATLRNTYKQRRKALTDKDRLKLDDLILIQFQKLILHDVHAVLSYWPIKSHYEINTLPITDYLSFKIPGLRVCFPKTDFAQTKLQAIEVEKERMPRTGEIPGASSQVVHILRWLCETESIHSPRKSRA